MLFGLQLALGFAGFEEAKAHCIEAQDKLQTFGMATLENWSSNTSWSLVGSFF